MIAQWLEPAFDGLHNMQYVHNMQIIVRRLCGSGIDERSAIQGTRTELSERASSSVLRRSSRLAGALIDRAAMALRGRAQAGQLHACETALAWPKLWRLIATGFMPKASTVPAAARAPKMASFCNMVFRSRAAKEGSRDMWPQIAYMSRPALWPYAL